MSVALFWLLGNGENAARHASTQFATALVTKHPAQGPKGAIDYIDGIHANYGPVKSARVIDARNTSHGSGQSAYTYFVADVLLETAKGPMVVELAFNSPSLDNKTRPSPALTSSRPPTSPTTRSRTPSSSRSPRRSRPVAGRSPTTATSTASGCPTDKRTPQPPNAPEGHQEADRQARSEAGHPSTTEPDAVPTTSPEQKEQLRDATTMLECVQKAKGDVEKMSRCAN